MAALAQAIWFFARPGRPDIDPRLLADLARERWTPLAYDHARVALGRQGRVPPPVTEGFEESCEALLRRVGVSARAREPRPTHP